MIDNVLKSNFFEHNLPKNDLMGCACICNCFCWEREQYYNDWFMGEYDNEDVYVFPQE